MRYLAVPPASVKPYAVFITDALAPALQKEIAQSFGAILFEKAEAHLPILPDALAVTDGPVLVFIGAPAFEVARKLERGQTVLDACEEWAREARSLLSDRRRSRSRTTVFYLDTLVRLTPATLDAVEHCLRQAPEIDPDIYIPLPALPLQIIAQLAIVVDPALKEIADEFATFAFGSVEEGEITQRLSAALDIHNIQQKELVSLHNDVERAAKHIDELLPESKRHETEITLLRDVVAAQIVEGERLQAKLDEAETVSTANTMNEANNRALEMQVANVETRMKHREAVLGAQILQMAAQQYAVGTQVEISQRDCAALKVRVNVLLDELHLMRQARESAEQRVVMLEQELSKVYKSRSWRITAPLRATRSKLSFWRN